jgi:two-component system response regulator HydG
VAAPLIGFPDERVGGLLYADRRRGPGWDPVDVMAVGCVAHLVSAALAAVETRNALARENQALEESLGGGRRLVGSSPAAQGLLAFVAKVGPSDATILLTGESGSGKEMVAHAIHRASRRSRGPFIAVNCAAMTETLIESELFGHEKGAFTGATERKLGRFELADKGTLFLDEVGELPLNCQTKFLRVLEERLFERVGGTRPIAVDVRVIAATNRNLAEMVRLGQFREDLYYRLSVIHNVVPPLRQRAGDIPELAEHFLAQLRSQVARRVTGFTGDAIRALMAHPWPGNVRELRNAIERAIVLGEGELIRLEDLPPDLGGGAPAPISPAPLPELAGPPPGYGPTPPPMPTAAPAPIGPVARSLRDLERDGIIAALRATGGNKAQAAAILEIDRSTLYKKLKDYDIET